MYFKVMDNITMIDSVLGFDLKADIIDNQGNLIKAGIKRSIIVSNDPPNYILPKLSNRNFFTHFNEDLLRKIIDFRKLND